MTTKPFLLLLLIFAASTVGDAQGSRIIVYLKDSTEISGEFFSVRDSAILVCTNVNLREWEIPDNISSFALLNAIDIHKVKVMGRHSTFPLGTLVGAALGAGFGALLASIEPGMWGGGVNTGPSRETTIIVTTIMFGMGGLISEAGNAIPDTVIDITEPSAIWRLREFARYKDHESPSVKLIGERRRQK